MWQIDAETSHSSDLIHRFTVIKEKEANPTICAVVTVQHVMQSQ